ncbi:hypothetical protein EDC94DRAFT_554298 [Helicostylum pulchrum]|nr:hypothetical protein EDC94DRAFT_554298 [Helicostylum pulchrum]
MERKNTSVGLSSTLDLINLTEGCQSHNFEPHEWEDIKSKMMDKYGSKKECHVPKDVASTWKIVTALS